MLIDIITIFPDIFTVPLETGMLRKARQKGVMVPRVWNLRDFAEGRHRQVDDYPYGGGKGMVLKPEPIYSAIKEVVTSSAKVILMSPGGETLTQELVQSLSKEQHLVFIAGRYEGVDERVRNFINKEISIGDYILTGGELPALVVIDAVTRLLPGVLSPEAVTEESFTKGILDYPQYTRPELFRGFKVPEVLLSGNHREVKEWRKREALKYTAIRRPDLLEEIDLNVEEKQLVSEIQQEGAEYDELN